MSVVLERIGDTTYVVERLFLVFFEEIGVVRTVNENRTEKRSDENVKSGAFVTRARLDAFIRRNATSVSDFRNVPNWFPVDECFYTSADVVQSGRLRNTRRVRRFVWSSSLLLYIRVGNGRRMCGRVRGNVSERNYRYLSRGRCRPRYHSVFEGRIALKSVADRTWTTTTTRLLSPR